MSCPAGYLTAAILTGSVALSFRTVGISNSDFGLLELMWNSLPMRKSSCTVAELTGFDLHLADRSHGNVGTVVPGS